MKAVYRLLLGCRKGQSRYILHWPWAIIGNSKTVVCDQCTCMVGLGETCSHVDTLLYHRHVNIKLVDMQKLVLHQSPMHG